MKLAERIAQIKELEAKATDAPWEGGQINATGVVHHGFSWIAASLRPTNGVTDALLIASMRNVINDLLDVVEKQNVALMDARFFLRLNVYSKSLDRELTAALALMDKED